MRHSLIPIIFLLTYSRLAAQDVYLPYKVPQLPLEFKYEQSFPPKEVKKYTWIASDGQSEFYIKITRIGPLYNADSLKAFLFRLYDDPQIKNLQVRELNESTLGGKKVFKCVVAFMARDKWYLSTAFMVPMYLNARYNAVLFYFEMGELRAHSYAMIQEKMVETLRYTEFPFIELAAGELPFSLCMPEIWDQRPGPSAGALLLTDDRAHLLFAPLASQDTLPAGKLAEAEKEKLRAEPRYAQSKIKATTEKVGKFTFGKVSLLFNESLGKSFIPMSRHIWLVPLRGLAGTPGYRVEFTCPTEFISHYEPLLIRILRCWTVGGLRPFAEL
ncbi:MAG: hypothetical protein N2110_06760 [Flavobacteriales bacterium]|nr:hypothetical protein [Flavobacteriales bacterium]MCX7768704.1 hypothetical protein [Flavobacteriales bacterium]MDW8410097.1 hypothetical protein [Flavobacteriales bacterium]